MNDQVLWLALQEKYWLITPEKIAYAIQKMGSIERFWNADKLQLFKLGLSRNAIENKGRI